MSGKQEEVIPVYVTPKMKKAIELAAVRDGRSTSNYLQWYGWQRAQDLGVTLDGLEVDEDASKSE